MKNRAALRLSHQTAGEQLVTLALVFFSLLAVIDYFLHRRHSIYFLPLNLLIILIFLNLPDWRRKSQAKPELEFWLLAGPLAGYAYLYKLAGSLVALITSIPYDRYLANLDMKIFSVSPNKWVVGLYRPWLTELLMLAYVAYLPLVVILAYLLFKKNGREQTELYIFSLGLAYLACFVLFIIFPAYSPRFYFSDLDPAPGYFFRRLMDKVEVWGQYRGGSFPSAHCAAGTVMIYYAAKAGRRTFWLVFPLILLFFFSTVYGQYHYVVDILSGIIIGWLAIRAACLLTQKKPKNFSQPQVQ
ncbi:MAG TPA: phosphatase PAP2 family protein [Candidatus Saccharicenans sp.]|nr:phosphatase PAP2 family protein [Candidatus Saccharicenans sp.]HOL45721.1 phosphatase PAP2 family protein [Candidatus Saccharicenans sp.]HPC87531.1 phosphatase PAP2 family protein [Candidatus Saccharicenans sp.]HPP23849.1 phosphatase PAP2 family protein [Candidatus Saccharicenans sp.]HRT25138.1 phosphatase PAP2 family protein [Candidatus Saccharicenans sp.]